MASSHSCRSTAIAPRLNRIKGSSGRSSSSRRQHLAVALELPGPQVPVDIARVPDGQVRPAHRHTGSPQCGQDLLVNAVRPADIVAEGKQPDVVDDRLAPGAVGLGSQAQRTT